MRAVFGWIVLGALLCVGCSDDVTGTDDEQFIDAWFEMTSLDNENVPHVLSSEGNCQTIYEGGFIALELTGGLHMELDRKTELCDGQPVRAEFSVLEGRYSIVGEVIEFSNESGVRIVGRYLPMIIMSDGGRRLETIDFTRDGHEYWFTDRTSEWREE